MVGAGLVVNQALAPGRVLRPGSWENGETIRGPDGLRILTPSVRLDVECVTEQSSITSPALITVQGPQIAKGGGRKPEGLASGG